MLIVDDQPFVRESLRTLLDRYEDLNVVSFARMAIKPSICVSLQPHMLYLMDLDMQHMNESKQPKIKQQWPHIRVLIFTTFQDTEQALESLRKTVRDGFLSNLLETLELAITIRLIHKGGTLIDQECLTKYLRSLMSKRDITIKSNRL
ncbi:response regulator [Bacillus pacificus]